MASVAPQRALDELLRSLFSGESLRRFLAYLPEGEDLSANIPGSSASLAELTHAATQILLQRGLVNTEFFQELLDMRPGRAADILRVHEAFQTPASTSPEFQREERLGALAATLVDIFGSSSPPPVWLFLVAGIDATGASGPHGIDWRHIVEIAADASSLPRLVAAILMHPAGERLKPLLFQYPMLFPPRALDGSLQRPVRLLLVVSEVDREAQGQLSERIERLIRLEGGISFEVTARFPNEEEWPQRPPDLIVLAVTPALLDGRAAIAEEVTRIKAHQESEGTAVLAVVVLSSAWDATPLAQARFPVVPHDSRGVMDILLQGGSSSTAVQETAWDPVLTGIRSLLYQQRIRRVLGTLDPPAHTAPTAEPAHAVAPALKAFKTTEVFRTSGVPGVTFVRPTEFGALTRELRNMGVGLIVEGPSGIGKTVAVQKALLELQIAEDRKRTPPAGLDSSAFWYRPRGPSDAEAQRVDTLLATGHWDIRGHHIIDDFHLLSTTQQQAVGDLIKVFADTSRNDAKLTVIGIPLTGETLAALLGDAFGRMEVVRLGREHQERIEELIGLGERALNLRFIRHSELALASVGSFSLAQQLCRQIVEAEEIGETCRDLRDLDGSPSAAADRLLGVLRGIFHAPLQEFVDAQNKDRQLVAAAYYVLINLADSPEGSIRIDDVRPGHLDVGAGFTHLEHRLTSLGSSTAPWRRFLQYDAGTGRIYTQDPRLSWYLRWMDRLSFGIQCGLRAYFSVTGRQLRVDLGPAIAAQAPTPAVHVPTQRIIRLIHLSDFHFRATSGWDSGTVLERLQDDIASFRDGWSPDLILITGDVAFGGRADDYRAASGFLRDNLLPACKLDTSRLVMVPGNHDIDRQGIGNLGKLVQHDVLASRSNSKLSEILRDPEARSTLLRRHGAWLTFLNELGVAGCQWDVPWRGVTFTIRDVKIHFAALCSSLLCADDGDRGKLVLGLPQVNQALAGARAAHVVVSALHHPWDYFADWDDAAHTEIARSSSLVLRGHLHSSNAIQTKSPFVGDVVELAAGASYESSELPMAYLLVELDIGSEKLRTQCRSWNPRRRGWRLDHNEFGSDWWESPLRVFQSIK